MKVTLAGLLAFVSLALSTTTPNHESSGIAKRATNAFAVGTKINIDGSTKYFVGTNSYWISFLNDAGDVDQAMKNMAASGLKVLRVWGFNDVSTSTSGPWFQSFISGQSPQINTGANGLQKLDTVVAAAEKYNIKLIIPFVNYWDDYGGMAVYAKYYGVSKTAWYTNSNCQTQYKKFISAVVSRYKSSTSIFAWELANEPRCQGCATSVITNWASTISAYIKSLDSTHMVALGDEGFMNGGGDGSYPYTTYEGVDFAANLKISTLDIGTFHLYTDAWGLSANPGGNDWFKNHAAACAAAGKPCIAEEYGIKSNKQPVMTSWQSDVRGLQNSGLAGDMFWQWGESLPNWGTTHDDGYTIYYGSNDWQKLVRDHVSAVGGGGAGPTTTAIGTSTTSTPKPTPTSGGGTLPKWSQCAGNGWTGSGTCVSGTVCNYMNEWYSQCY
ncbi:hypothetical protein V493_02314 [Pseudogymnoascus sp. VKM F-4281 (FW-2241)]|nr:hypothetical protein V493_02314 [Pseudogymnoascus sp. VKM F-4281 (FW-2241)]